MEVEVHGSYKNLSAAPDIAFEYQPNGQPWPSITAAHNGTPAEFRAIGKRRMVDDGSGMDEYWYYGGTALENLVLKGLGTGASVDPFMMNSNSIDLI